MSRHVCVVRLCSCRNIGCIAPNSFIVKLAINCTTLIYYWSVILDEDWLKLDKPGLKIKKTFCCGMRWAAKYDRFARGGIPMTAVVARWKAPSLVNFAMLGTDMLGLWTREIYCKGLYQVYYDSCSRPILHFYRRINWFLPRRTEAWFTCCRLPAERDKGISFHGMMAA
jgi:hypothetical protein